MAIRADKAALTAAAASSGIYPANARTIALAVGLPVRTMQYAMKGRPLSDQTWNRLREAFGDGWWLERGTAC